MRQGKVGRWIGRLALLALLAGALTAGAAVLTPDEFEWATEFEWAHTVQP
jgi:hypothetical protein